jgi:chromosome segregation ATPase
VRDELAKAKANHEKAIEETDKAHNAAISDLNAAHELKVLKKEEALSEAASKSTHHIAELEATRQAAERAAADTSKSSEKTVALAEQIEKLKKQLEGVQKELLAAKTKRDNDVKALEEQLSASKKQLEGLKTHTAEVEKATEKAQSSGKDSLVSATAEHSTAMTALKTAHSTAMAAKEEALNRLLQVRIRRRYDCSIPSMSLL